MDQHIVTKDVTVLKDVEVPLLKLVHQLQYVSPLARIHINDLPDTLFIFFQLGRVWLSILSMQLFQEVIQVSLKPLCCVASLLCSDGKPGLRLHILVPLSSLV